MRWFLCSQLDTWNSFTRSNIREGDLYSLLSTKFWVIRQYQVQRLVSVIIGGDLSPASQAMVSLLSCLKRHTAGHSGYQESRHLVIVWWLIFSRHKSSFWIWFPRSSIRSSRFEAKNLIENKFIIRGDSKRVASGNYNYRTSSNRPLTGTRGFKT